MCHVILNTPTWETLVMTKIILHVANSCTKFEVSPGLSCGVVCLILRLAVLVEHRFVADRQTDLQTHRHTAIASCGKKILKIQDGGWPICLRDPFSVIMINFVEISILLLQRCRIFRFFIRKCKT